MLMTTKADVINGCYSQMRISGLTVNPTPELTKKALSRLEDLMYELEARNICLNFNFESTPDPSSLTHVHPSAKGMMESNLAIRLIPDFNKVVPQALYGIASGTLSTVSSIAARENTRRVQYSRRMPRGSDATLRFNRWQRFQRPPTLPTNECATKNLRKDEVEDYSEDFTTYLEGETISSYTITADTGLSILSNSQDDPFINYTIKGLSNDNALQKVVITVTTSTGRIEKRDINFGLTS